MGTVAAAPVTRRHVSPACPWAGREHTGGTGRDKECTCPLLPLFQCWAMQPCWSRQKLPFLPPPAAGWGGRDIRGKGWGHAFEHGAGKHLPSLKLRSLSAAPVAWSKSRVLECYCTPSGSAPAYVHGPYSYYNEDHILKGKSHGS